jgi:hypothetical protein
MSARDELRKYVNLMGDMWTSPKVTDERVERLYAAVRAEVLAEAKAETAATYLAAAALVDDRACDADFTHDPQHIAGLREAVELLTRRAGEVR